MRIISGSSLFLTVLALYFIFNYATIGDSSPYEADEYSYNRFAEDFNPKELTVYYLGKPHYVQGPLYPALGYAISKLGLIGIKPLKFLSILSAVIAAFLIYLYTRRLLSENSGILAGILFLLMPLSVFYARTSVYEMFFTALIFAFFVSFEKSVATGKYTWMIFSGILLGLSLLTKIFSVLLVLYLFLMMLRSMRISANKGFISVKLKRMLFVSSSVSLVTGLITAFSVYIYNFTLHPLQFILGMQNLFGKVGSESPLIEFALYLANAPYLFSWGIALAAALGLAIALKSYKGYKELLLFSFIWLLPSIIVSTQSFHYFVYFTPFMAILSAISISRLAGKMRHRAVLIAVGAVFFAVLVLPQSAFAYKSTQSTLLSDATSKIKEVNAQHKYNWLFTNYIPSVLSNYFDDIYVSHLTTSACNARDFVGNRSGLNEKLLNASPVEMIQNGEPAIVMLISGMDHLRSGDEGYYAAERYIKTNFAPDFTVYDNPYQFPHVPFARIFPNTANDLKAEIYVIDLEDKKTEAREVRCQRDEYRETLNAFLPVFKKYIGL